MGKKILAMLLAAALAVAFAVPSAAVSGKVAGGADGTVKTVDTRQTIDTADITYQNMRVENNLTISEEVGRGTVTLKNVVITGTLLIRSGGPVVLDGVTCPNVTIQNPKYKPTVIATGSTSIDTTYLKGNCVIEERDLSAGGEGYLDVVYSPNVNYELTNVSLERMTKGVNAPASGRSFAGSSSGSGGGSGGSSTLPSAGGSVGDLVENKG